MEIGYGAFSDCSGLKSVSFEKSVVRIGNYAFQNCTSLTHINFPETLEKIGWCSFENCSSFVSILGKLTDTAKSYLRIMLVVSSYYVAGKSVNMTTISGIFCAGGDSRFGFICDTVTMWAVTVPLGLIAAFVLKLQLIGGAIIYA